MSKAAYVFLVLVTVMASAATSAAKAQSVDSEDVLLISGNMTEESLDLSFFLRRVAVVDGVKQTMSAAECEASFVVRAIGLADTGETVEMTDEISLFAGDLQKFNVSFMELKTDNALIEFTDVRRKGPCNLLSTGRLVGLGGETKTIICTSVSAGPRTCFFSR